MAKRRKKSKVSRSKKRSRVSGLGGIDVMNILTVVVGAAAGGFVDKFIPETIDRKISAGGKIALGVVLPMLSKNGKTKNMLAGVGSGLIAIGAVDLLKGFGVLSGADDIAVIDSTYSNPFLSADVLGNDDDLSVVNADVLGNNEDLSVINNDDYVYEDDEF